MELALKHRTHIENLPNRYYNSVRVENPVLDQTISHLLNEHHSWLTIGDTYGSEAAYLIRHGQEAVASDLSTRFLENSHKRGLIYDYEIINAEDIEISDNNFDYVLCKLSLHHMARPYKAIYEMIRVAKKAVILIEPCDPLSYSVGLFVLCKHFPRLADKLWKNRRSHEDVGNYVFKLSEREVEKISESLFLPEPEFKYVKIYNHKHLCAIIHKL